MTTAQRTRNAARTAALMECLTLSRNGVKPSADYARQLWIAVGGAPSPMSSAGGELWTAGGAVVTFTPRDGGANYAVTVTASRI